ncbi:MAG: ClbS/DfsB family four-helix bundle protein [Anaerolineales bacterium]
MITVDGMIDALEAEYAHERAFLDGLTAESRGRHGTEEAWSARDLQAHIMAWKHQTVLRLKDDPSAVVEESEDDTERANAVFFAAYADRSWESVLEESETTHQELIKGLGQLADDDMAKGDAFAWQDGRPLWRQLAGTLLLHPWMHMAEHAIERGDEVAALDSASAMAEQLAPLNDEPTWIGVLQYNAACLSARAGGTDQALDWLRLALELRPDLIEWSKEDSDLDSLRSDERLAELYSSLGED